MAVRPDEPTFLRISTYLFTVKGGHNLRPVVLATVHEDVAKWLHADWVLYTQGGQLAVYIGCSNISTSILYTSRY